MDFDFIFTWLASWLGVDLPTLLAYLAVFMTLCNLLGRVIPDTATGFLGVVRAFAKVMGLYLANRVQPGVSVNDLAATAASTAESAKGAASQAYSKANVAVGQARHAAAEATQAKESAAEIAADPTKAMARDGRGKFLPKQKPDSEGLEHGEPR